MSTTLLRRAVAYAIQEQLLGGLKKADQRVLDKFGGMENSKPKVGNCKSNDLSYGAPAISSESFDSSDRTLPKFKLRQTLRNGTRLIRSWQGHSHVVDVKDDGFMWNGKVYGSLTKVAFAITGAHWSGPRFFRL
jgi:Protein of unknown function (DUF2924)